MTSSEAVHSPLSFPDPLIFRGGLRRVRVHVGENRFEDRRALHSPNGAVYEFRRNMKKAIYGCVYLAVQLKEASVTPLLYARSEKKVAVKVVDRQKAAARTCQEDPLKEISVAQFLGTNPHPHIMDQLETIADDIHLFIVMEFSAGGELYDLLDNARHFSESLARQCFSQVAAGLEHLHEMGVCHRDLSLENILAGEVRQDGSHDCKIIDFGMSLRFAKDKDGRALPFPPLGPCGKRYYMAPEVLANRDPFIGPVADIWALGVMLFILLVGAPPVESASPLHDRFCRIAAGEMRDMVAEWGVTYVSDQALDLLEGILRVDPNERLSLADIKAHAWMNPTA